MNRTQTLFTARNYKQKLSSWVKKKAEPLHIFPDHKILLTPEEIEKLRHEGYREGIKQAAFDHARHNQHDLVAQGRKEAIKETAKDTAKAEEKSLQKLHDLNAATERVLLHISSVFPFDFFPDDVVIDQNKVSAYVKIFFSSGRRQSVYIKDIIDVIVETSIIFATLKVVDTGYAQNHIVVRFLRKKDAEKARRIIQGLVLAYKENIDVSKLDAEELVDTIESIGTMKKEV